MCDCLTSFGWGMAGEKLVFFATVDPLTFLILNIIILQAFLWQITSILLKVYNLFNKYSIQSKSTTSIMILNSSSIIPTENHITQIPESRVNTFINNLTPLQHTKQQYENLLEIWNQQRDKRQKDREKWQQVLQAQPKQAKDLKRTSICLVCYEELNKKRNWCRLCGMECCEKCIGRYRVIKSNYSINQENSQNIEPVPTCETCDKKYIQAMIEKEDAQEFQLRQAAFQKIIQMDKLLLTQSQEYGKSSQRSQGRINQLRNLVKTVSHLQSLNQSTKQQNLQLHRKISWGQDVKQKLKSKYRKLAKELKIKSFESSSASAYNDMRTQSTNSKYINPPTAYESDLNRSESQNLNSSVLNSVLEDESRMITSKGRCCVACNLM